ncbi:hypothetical protein IAT40_006167 [Kwoniella sp. CBS 6097]
MTPSPSILTSRPDVKVEEDDLSDMVNISPPSPSTALMPDTHSQSSPDSTSTSTSISTSDHSSRNATNTSAEYQSSPAASIPTSDSTDSNTDTSIHIDPEAMSTPTPTPANKRGSITVSNFPAPLIKPTSRPSTSTSDAGSSHPRQNGLANATEESGKHQLPKTGVNVKADGEVLKEVQSVVEDTVRRVRQQSDKFQSAAQPYADKTRSFAERRPVLFTFLVLWATFSIIPILFFLTFALISTAIIASTAIFFLALTIIGTILLAASILLCTLCGGLLVLFPVLCVTTFMAFGALSTLLGIFLAHRLYLHISLAAAEDKAGFSIATLARGIFSWIDETVERIPLPFEYSFPRLSTNNQTYADRKVSSQQYGPHQVPRPAERYNEKDIADFSNVGGLDEKWFSVIKEEGGFVKGDGGAPRLHTNAISDGRIKVEDIESLNLKNRHGNATANGHGHENGEDGFGGSVLSEKEGWRYESKPTPRLDIWPPAPKVKV